VSASNEEIGRTSSTAREPSTTERFYFWVRPNIKMNPFDFVAVQLDDGSSVVGQVDEISNYTDAESHLSNYIGNSLEGPSRIERLQVVIAEATVLANLRNDGAAELLMPVPSDRPVRFANEKEVSSALGYDRILGEKIPAGLIKQSSGNEYVVYLDSHYIIGPEGAHVNITGISGLATKTSYAMFLINSIYQKLKGDLAVVIFNVKHSDLLHVDEEPNDLTELDKDMYDKLDLDPKPFPSDKVAYYLPRGKGGKPDSDKPPQKYNLYAYTLRDVHENLDLLLADVPDQFGTIGAFTSYVRDNWKNDKIDFDGNEASNWSQLLEIPDEAIGSAVYNYPRHQTPPRVKREIRRRKDSAGIFVDSRGSNEVYLGERIVKDIKERKISVIDIYRIHTIVQPFIVGDVMRSIENGYRNGEFEDLKGLIIFIDELNTFAPDSSSPNAIAEHIIEIARKGRGRKTALFGAQQFKSQVHPQVWGNCSLHVIGKVGSAELSTTPYRELSQHAKNTVMGLKPGEVLLSFSTWRSPIKVVFPKPAYKRSK
jgi:DNA helicase HerA-like ATPase